MDSTISPRAPGRTGRKGRKLSCVFVPVKASYRLGPGRGKSDS
jgi:hypothetical protein